MKAYVIDTSALLDDPELIYKLGFDDTAVIPTAVIKELDGLKKDKEGFEGRSARDVARTLDQLGSYQDLAAGAKLRTGTILRTCTGFKKIKDFESDIDNRVVGAALKLKGQYKYVSVISRDGKMRDVARACGLKAKNWPFSLTKLDKAAPAARAKAETKTKIKKVKIQRPPMREGILRRFFRLIWAAFNKGGKRP